ncbi:hypothetical protein GOACH_26_00430 [Gordonia aichiensis NBRC 108223]|uniref:Uncharacterized protein n=1 Tax=Gordonia aichiensis NBRC 108223 TaxID=1220583 RepID=L7KQ05_9ACTN|nr:hypothetical protein GOACH_26_00430 [Gordonia aichiensis NBRC 108223]
MSGIDIYNYSARLRRQRTRVIKEYGERALLFPRAQSAQPRKAQKILGTDNDPVPPGQRFWLKSTFMRQFWQPIRSRVPSWEADGITPYSIRHLYATWRSNSLGRTPAAVAASMGHRGVDLVFQRYVAAPDLPEAATAWLPPGASPIKPE